MKLLSPAKVNLRLEVLKKREDGYHDIFSIMQPIDLYDEITLKVKEGETEITVVCDHPQVPLDRNNLVYLAAEAFLKKTGQKRNIFIEIKKNIPVAAGLGGGSSNAATLLKGLNELSGEKLSIKELIDMGRRLGADVPFFILSRGSIVRGIGEIIEEVDIPKFWYLLVNPGFPVSTKEVYKLASLNLTKKKVSINITGSLNLLNTPLLFKRLLYNDLERVVLGKYPELTDIKRKLIEAGASGSLVSGSGPTVFGLFPEESIARQACAYFKERSDNKRWRVFLAQGCNR